MYCCCKRSSDSDGENTESIFEETVLSCLTIMQYNTIRVDRLDSYTLRF